ncbi:MAG: leucine-rich repeat domain-containing protein [Acholeplasmataceae bacterium]|jgi:hypothetical protein|nr:leucine-rich repeat domain-containing protein [Acholeplasmataceae bacterium]
MKKIGLFLGILLIVIFLTSCGGKEDKIKTYKVTWKNYDDTVLEVDENVPLGTMPSFDGDEPTKDGYTFMGWEPEIKKVTGDVTYVAKFVPVGTETYTVTWKNHDGTVLEKDLNVPNGTMPEYNGDTPTKPGGYTFTGWTPTVSVVTKDIEYTATFKLVEVSTDDYIFALKGDGYALIHYLGDDENVVIPEVYKEKPVTSIEQWAFEDNKTMTSVVIPNSVIEIKEDAFYNCQTLKTVTFGSNVKSIGMNAFYGCTSLESVILPEGLTYLGEMVFMDCEALKSVILPNSVENFGSFMFWGADAVIFNEYENGKYLGNTTNPHLVFIGLIDDSATTIKFHNNCKVIADDALGDTNIETIDFGTGVEIIGRSAFSGCQQLKDITIPNNVIKIGDMAFQSSSITKITIGNNVKHIGISAFEYCSNLTDVSLPNGIEYIDMYAFNYCDSLTRAIHDNGYYLGNNENPYLCLLDVDNNSISNITIHEDAKIIASYTFSDCRNLTTVTIPKNVKKIGKGAFYGCKNLTEVIVDANNTAYEAPNKKAIIEKETKTLIVGLNNTVILEGVLHIGDFAFYSCEELTSIVIPDGVISIGDNAFRYCMKLESATIPNSVTHIGENAFGDCYKLASVTIPNNLKFIDNSVFSRCKTITSIIIPDSVSYIGNNAFRDCESLTDVTFGSNVVVIGEDAFESCPLTEIKIPNSVKSIKYGAFYECAATTIEIGSGVEVIGMLAFGKCNQATTLKVNKENKVFDSRDNSNAIIRKDSNILVVGIKTTIIPNTVTSIGEYAFYGLESLENITLGSGVTSLGRYAFAYSGLSKITLNKELTSIDRYAFSNCSSLNMIVIPSSVTDIGANVFRNCTNLEIYAEATTQPTNWDENWNRSNCKVYWYSEISNTDGSHWRYVNEVPTVWLP